VLAVSNWTPPYLDDTLCERGENGWLAGIGSGAGGIHWVTTDEGEGVLSLIGEAPDGATAAVVAWRDDRYEAPVAAGHFFFVAWHVPEEFEHPELLRFVGA
jgi:hypothetical protein